MRIVDDDQERLCSREVCAQPVEPVQQRERRVDIRAKLAVESRIAQQAEQTGPRPGTLLQQVDALRLRQAGQGRLEQLAHHAKGEVTFELAPPGSQDAHPAVRSNHPRRSKKAVFPIPAGPSSKTNVPIPSRALVSAYSIRASSRSRSRSELASRNAGFARARGAGAACTEEITVERSSRRLQRRRGGWQSRIADIRSKVRGVATVRWARLPVHDGQHLLTFERASDDHHLRLWACPELREQTSGSVLEPADAGYDAARTVHNGLIDRRPALIVRGRTTNDVVAALAFARRDGDRDLDPRRRAQRRRARRHGRRVDDRSRRDEGDPVDPDRATARAEGGVVWGELNERLPTRARRHRRHVSGTGIAGYTLGGGLGWLMAKYGLAADNLLAAEVVTAEGAFSTSSRVATGSLLGTPRWRRQLRRRDGVHLPLAPVAKIVGGLIAHPIAAAPTSCASSATQSPTRRMT